MANFNWTLPISKLREDGIIDPITEAGFAECGLTHLSDLKSGNTSLPPSLKAQASLLCSFLNVVIACNFHSLNAETFTTSVPEELLLTTTFLTKVVRKDYKMSQVLINSFGDCGAFLFKLFTDKELVFQAGYHDYPVSGYRSYRRVVAWLANVMRLFCECFDSCRYYARYIKLIMDTAGIDQSEVVVDKPYGQPHIIDCMANSVIASDKEKLFKQLVSKLSTRSRNVLSHYQLDTYAVFKTLAVRPERNFMSLKQCGKQSAEELEVLWKRMAAVEKDCLGASYGQAEGGRNARASTVPTYEEVVYLLQAWIEQLSGATLWQQLLGLFGSTKNLAADFVEDAAGVYHTIQCVKEEEVAAICDALISQIAYMLLTKASASAGKPIIFPLLNFVLLYADDRPAYAVLRHFSDDKLKVVQAKFDEMTNTRISVRSKNVLVRCMETLDKESFVWLAGNPHNFANMEGAGKRCAGELNVFLEYFRSFFVKELLKDDTNVKLQVATIKFPFLKSGEIKFVNDFYTAHGHYPMFFVASRFFSQYDNRYVDIYADYYGIGRDKVLSLMELSDRYDMTRERIRQIVSTTDWIAKETSFAINTEEWAAYPIIHEDVITDETEGFRAFDQEEKVKMSFLAFCGIVNLFNPLTIDKLLKDNGDSFYVAHTRRIRNFNLGSAMREIRRLAALDHEETIKINLYTNFANNRQYWAFYHKQKFTLTEEYARQAFSLLSTVCRILALGKIDKDCNLVVEPNKINYSQVIYDILRKHGKPMHINDIFDAFVKLCPGDKHRTPLSLKFYITKDDRMESMGRTSTFKLKAWDYFAGNISELLDHILSGQKEPMKSDDLIAEALRHRPSSTVRSMESNIGFKLSDGVYRMYYPDLVGWADRLYDDRFKIVPHTFSEFLKAFVNFVEEHKRYPLLKNHGYESMLYRWHHEHRNMTGLSPNERNAFSRAMASLEAKHYPQGVLDSHFLKNCDDYKRLVAENKRLVNEEDDRFLFNWFTKGVSRHDRWEGNKAYYFNDLLAFIDGHVTT